jgi:hypothetical protein
MAIDHARCPWSVPVRIEAGRFVALWPRHAALNLRTAPLPPFGSEAEPAARDALLYADLQTALHMQVAGRLGSGRAGFHRGWYIKGVGRTPLAANWNDGDHLHNSGHMAASSAIREYVASLYLAECGAGASIVPCEGVLFAELDPSLRDFRDHLYGRGDAVVPAVDRSLQALSVKPGNFARASNFVWLLHHLTPAAIESGHGNLITLCELLAAALAPGAPTGELTPDALADQLEAAVRAAIDRFERWFACGVWWASYSNNLTLDGRFLDLETPAILGGPLVGCLAVAHADGRARRTATIGFDQLSALAQTRAFCVELVRVVGQLPAFFSPIEREFGASLAGAIEARLLAPDGVLGARDVIAERLLAMIDRQVGGLRAPDRDAVRRLIFDEHARWFGAPDDPTPPASPPLSLISDAPRLLIEPGARLSPAAFELPSGLRIAPSAAQLRTARHWAEVIEDLDHTTALPDLLDKLTALTPRGLP